MSSQFYTIFAVILGSGVGYKLNFPAGAMVGGLLGIAHAGNGEVKKFKSQ
ncbi:hypothetical protein [Cloacibacillus evryensis]|nr:hypothetical protein [Cloacibacillus evryensis]EXG78804.1 hypothetical protein Cloev_0949 [Cloacibacillus evryensis DSM 19522]MEA5035743.1 hypothetical protein [Cloacibacillus evryensis]